jgi:hypothetical protein
MSGVMPLLPLYFLAAWTGIYFLGACVNCEKRLLASSCILSVRWSVCLSVCLFVCLCMRTHGTTRLPLCGFSWNFVSDGLSKSCRENSNFVRIWQEFRALDMKTFSHLWQYLDEFFLEWEMFQTKVVEKKHILCLITYFFCENSPFMRWHGKRNTRHSWRDNRWQYNTARALCMLDNWEYTHTYCFSTSPVVTRTSLSVTLHALCLSCYLSSSLPNKKHATSA